MAISSFRYKAVLFDVDGVILDSRENMATAWAAVREQTGVDTPFEAYFAEIGRPFRDIMVRLGLADRAEQIERVFRSASANALGQTPIFDGIPDVLLTLAAYSIKLGIVTSKDAGRTGLVLDRLPVTFQCATSPRPDLRGKPAPDCLLYTIAKLNLDPAECIFIGDMISDEVAAERAGIDYTHAEWGYGSFQNETSATLKSPNDILTLLGIKTKANGTTK